MRSTFNHQHIIDQISATLQERYVNAEIAEEMSRYLQAHATDYQALDDGADLARRLTRDIREISKDMHLRVDFRPEEAESLLDNRDDHKRSARKKQALAAENFGFYCVRWLKGSIGYIDVRQFAPPSLGGDVAVAAMRFLESAKALIFDLRQNVGGSPSMVQLLTSYLFGDDAIHLNTFYTRYKDEHRQFWTLPYVPGRRFANADVYVVISNSTFSGGEEFAYNLKVMNRATLVGETTRGGANPGERIAVDEQFTMFVPDGRAINPVTHSSWEGTGVVPHIEAHAMEALQVAHKLALERLLPRAADDREEKLLRAELRLLGGETSA